jgi:hypothetical protein
MSTSIYFVTKLREILIIAEVNGDGGNTPGYNSTSTEAFTADIFIYIFLVIKKLIKNINQISSIKN